MLSANTRHSRLRGYTLAALQKLGHPLQGGPDSRGTYRLGKGQAIRVYPSGTIVDYSVDNGHCYRDILEFVRRHVAEDVDGWIETFLQTEPEPDPFDSDSIQPEIAEATYAANIEAMWKRGRPIGGTEAEVYLTSRAIALSDWPDNLRHVDSAEEAGHRHYGALLSAKVTPDGTVAAVQVLFLDGSDKAAIDAPRREYVINRLAVPKAFCGFGPIFEQPAVIVTAEGVEDALSIHQATGLPTVASFGKGNLGCVPDCDDVVLFFDQDGKADDPAIDQAIQRAYASAEAWREPDIRCLMPPPRDGKNPKNDANLILQNEEPEVLKQMVEGAEPARIPISALAERFARMSPEQQANRRADFKSRVKDAGGTMKDFDALVTGYVRRFSDEAPAVGSLDGLISIVEPVADYVPTIELFEMIRGKLARYIVAKDWQLDLMAIWVMGTYVHRAVSIYPFLLFIAPTKAAGKTTAMVTVVKMSHRGFLNLSATEALLAQLIDALSPTLGLDEIDNLLSNKNEVSGIINGSYNKSTAQRGKLAQTEDGGWAIVSNSTWCPKVLAGINEDGGVLSEATLSRCIVIRMRPKTVEELTEHLDQFAEEELVAVQAFGQAWSRDLRHAIADAASDREIARTITDGFHGRDADNFRVILTIARMGGGDLFERIRTAAYVYLDDRKRSETPEMNRQLLADVVRVFRSTESPTTDFAEQMTATDICSKLTGDDLYFETDYNKWTRGGDPITASLLGRALKPFDIRSDPTHRPGTKNKSDRLFLWSDLEAAAKRYCPDALTDPEEDPIEPDPQPNLGDASSPPDGGEPAPSSAANTPPMSHGSDAVNTASAVRRGWRDRQNS